MRNRQAVGYRYYPGPRPLYDDVQLSARAWVGRIQGFLAGAAVVLLAVVFGVLD